jgi:triacylglycerol esterase/lipase EstA (alpha/beta hydrolase family)
LSSLLLLLTTDNGIALLVPGTALNGKDSFANGPFVQLLPSEGFDVCWVSPPNRQLADAQIGAEYVANAIIQLAKKSKTGKIKVLGHSQGGGLSVPWATIFFPSARKLVSSFVGMAADFHGTTLLPYPACAAEEIVDLGAGCSAAILQQEMGSMFLTAQLHFLTKQIVPTTSIFTRTDEIVIPQFGPNVSVDVLIARGKATSSTKYLNPLFLKPALFRSGWIYAVSLARLLFCS